MKFDLTPDPKVLIALTRTPLRPIDALCELIDNAIDSFSLATLQGEPVQFPTVTVQLPGQAEVKDGGGRVLVRDNGPGMSPEMAEKALRAGFSGQTNPYDGLGLFGMGFNISTGKIGRITRFVTAEANADSALEAVVDLIELKETGSYEVEATEISKPENLRHGTLVEIEGWWPDGDPNSGFVRKLAGYSKPKVREEVGRIYATLLRNHDLRISINAEVVQPFEHCVWAAERFVERKGHGKIYARQEFDEVIGQQRRCTACSALVNTETLECSACGSSSFLTIPERMKGWLGIQRFDDQTHYGVDLIRNGRAIRVFEQAAFFEFIDEFNERIKDYPIDQTYGRIVGEVHLDHVPVDFLKQDFQRSSEEWQSAMLFLRGGSSLQPGKPGADTNTSPMYRLYQGYRKVRIPGTRDLYIGTNVNGKPARFPNRDIEKEYRERFRKREPGYYDDAEWWKLVLDADTPPSEEVVECSKCSTQNLKTDESCLTCGDVLIGKQCVNIDCGETIPKSAVTCPTCGSSQVLEIDEPWKCEVCGEPNAAESDSCSKCLQPRGAPREGSPDWLQANSDRDDALCIPGMMIDLGDSEYTDPVDVNAYRLRVPVAPIWNEPSVPLVAEKTVERLDVFVDPNHALFVALGARPEDAISMEAAQYLHDTYRARLGGRRSTANALSTIAWKIANAYYSENLEADPASLVLDIEAFLGLLRSSLPDLLGDRSIEVLSDMDEAEQRGLFDRLLEAGMDLGSVGDLKGSSTYLAHVDNRTLVRLLAQYPGEFFDGEIWDVPYDSLEGMEGVKPGAIDSLKADVKARYVNCLEDIVTFSRSGKVDSVLVRRAQASLDYLLTRAVL